MQALKPEPVEDLKSDQMPTSFLQLPQRLLFLKNEDNYPVLREKISPKRQRQLTFAPQGDSEYMMEASLLHAQLQTLDFLTEFQQFSKQSKELQLKKTQSPVTSIEYCSKKYIQIHLNQFASMITPSDNNAHATWIELFLDKNLVGYIYIKQGQITILTDHPLMISGETPIEILNIFSMAEVCITEPLYHIGSSRIYCKNFEVSKDEEIESDAVPVLFDSKEINLFCIEACLLDGVIKTDALNIKAFEIMQTSLINGGAGLSLIWIAERMDLYGDIRTTGVITLITKKCNFAKPSSADESHTCRIFSKKTILIGGSFDLYGSFFNEGLEISAAEIIMAGKSVVKGDVILISNGMPGILYTHSTAEIELTGKCYQYGRWANQFAGFLKRYETGDFVSAEASPGDIFLASGHYLTVTGTLNAECASVVFKSNQLLFSGYVCQTTFFTETIVAIKAEALYYAGIIASESKMLVRAAELPEISGYIESKEVVEISAKQLQLQTITIKAQDGIIIQTEEDSKIDKEALVRLEAMSAVLWKCKNFYHYGKLDVPRFELQAKRLMKVYKGWMLGQQHHYKARYILSAFSAFSVKDRLSLSSYISLPFACLMSSNNCTTSSFFNGSFLVLSLPGSFEVSLPGAVNIFFAVTNTVFSLVQILCPDPVVQMGIVIARVAVNALPALYNIYTVGSDLSRASQRSGDQFTVLNSMIGVKTLLSISANLVLSGIGIASVASGTASSASSAIPSSYRSLLPNTWNEALPKIEDLVSNLMTMFPGERNYSVLNFRFGGASLGLEQVNANLVNVGGFNFTGFLSQFNSAALTFNPYSLDLNALSSLTCVYAYNLGNVMPLPVGSHSITSYQLYMKPLIPWSQSHMNIKTNRLIAADNLALSHSAIQAERVDSNNLQLNSSSLRASKWQIPASKQIRLINSHLSADQVKNEGRVESSNSSIQAAEWTTGAGGMEQYWQSVVKIAHHDIDPLGTILFFYSKFNVDDLNNAGALELFVTQMNAKHFLMEKDGIFSADGSKITGNQFSFLGNQIGSRATSWQVDAMDAKETFYLDDKQKFDPQPSQSFSYSSEMIAPTLDKNGAILYSLEKDWVIKDNEIVTLPNLQLEFAAPNITVKGNINSNANLIWKATNQLSFVNSKTTIIGSLDLSGQTVMINSAQIEAGGAISASGQELKLRGGAKLLAGGDILLNFAGPINSRGNVLSQQITIKHRQWFRTNSETITTYTFDDNLIASAGGSVTLLSGDKISLIGTNVAAKKPISLAASNDVDLMPLRATNHDTRTHDNLFHHDVYNMDEESASCSKLYSEDKINIVSGGNVHNVGSEMDAVNGINIVLTKENHRIVNKALILTTRYSEKHQGIYLKEIVGMTLPLNGQQLMMGLPLYSQSQQLTLPGDWAAKFSAIAHLLGKSINLSDQVLAAFRKNQFAALWPSLLGLSPTIGLEISNRSLSSMYQSLGPGMMKTNHLKIDAPGSEVKFDQNFAVDAKKTDIVVDSLEASGAKLITQSEQNASSLGINYNMLSLNVGGVQVTQSHQQHYHEDWLGQGLHFGDLNVQARVAELTGIELHVTQISGHISSINSSAAQLVSANSGYAVSVNSGYGGSFSNNNDFSQRVKILTPINLTAVPDLRDFSVDNLTLTGQINPQIQVEQLVAKPLYDISQKNSFHFSFPGKGGQICSFIDLGYSHASYLAEHNNHGFKIDKDIYHNSVFVIPLINEKRWLGFERNVQWLFSPSSQPVLAAHDLPSIKPIDKPAPPVPSQSLQVKPKQIDPLPALDFGSLYANSQQLSPQLYLSLDDLSVRKTSDQQQDPDPAVDLSLTQHLQELLTEDSAVDLPSMDLPSLARGIDDIFMDSIHGLTPDNTEDLIGDSYLKAVGRGAGTALLESVTNPYHLCKDIVVIGGYQLGGYFDADYSLSVSRMNERLDVVAFWVGLGQDLSIVGAGNYFQFLQQSQLYQHAMQNLFDIGFSVRTSLLDFGHASGLEQTETFANLLTSFLIPLGLHEGGSRLLSYHNFRTWFKPPLFYNNSMIGLSNPPEPMKLMTIQNLLDYSGNQTFLFVIKQQGELLITPVASLMSSLMENFNVVCHPELANFDPVIAAGTLRIQKNVMGSAQIVFDLASGHYCPNGDYLPKLIERVLIRNGGLASQIKFHKWQNWTEEEMISEPPILPEALKKLIKDVGFETVEDMDFQDFKVIMDSNLKTRSVGFNRESSDNLDLPMSRVASSPDSSPFELNIDRVFETISRPAKTTRPYGMAMFNLLPKSEPTADREESSGSFFRVPSGSSFFTLPKNSRPSPVLEFEKLIDPIEVMSSFDR